MEIKKKILVIDDDLGARKEFYKEALEERYEVNYTDNADLIYDVIGRSKSDLYIIDLNLSLFTDPKTNQPLMVESILEAVGKNKPIIILSGDYSALMDNGRLTPIIKNSAEEGFNVCSFFTWEDIRKVKEESRMDYKNSYKDALYTRIDFFINKDRSPYDFGVICALDEELAPFMARAIPDSISQNQIDGIHYKRSLIKTQSGHELNFVAACSSRMGISDAGIIASHMATRLGVKKIFMIGVCGGRESAGVDIGDVIIPSESIAFQRGKLKEDGFSSEVESSKPKESGIVKCDKAPTILHELFREYVDKMVNESGCTIDIKKPNIHYDVMACADYVIDKEGVLDEISKTIAHRKLCAVDMESYAIFRVGEILDIETLVIKSVMDLTNKKSDKFKSYTSFIAANYLYQLLYREEIVFPNLG